MLSTLRALLMQPKVLRKSSTTRLELPIKTGWTCRKAFDELTISFDATPQFWLQVLCWASNPKGARCMVVCPECESDIDVDVEEVEEGEIVSCPECGSDFEVVNSDPLELSKVEEEVEEEEEEEDEDEEDSDY
jgi:alpha-aminoadipate carrier protein LysW